MNGQSFRNITLARALTLMKESTHLSFTIKSNLMGFKEMLLRQDKEKKIEQSKTINFETNCSTNTLIMPNIQISSDFSDSNNDVKNIDSNKSIFLPQTNNKRQLIHDTKNLGLTNNHLNINKNNNTGTQQVGKVSMFEKLFTLLKGSSIASHEYCDNNTIEYDSTDEVSLFFSF